MQHQLEQLETDSGIEWQAFKIGDLFEKLNTNNVIKNTAGDLPATTATLSNNQIGRYISRKNATILNNVFSATANGFGKVFYQSKEFTILQDSYAFKFINSKIEIEKIQSFIITTLNKIFQKYDWGNKSGWERIKSETIQLPTTNSNIAFEFMEQFIATLQAERLATLQAYLKTTGLADTVLTEKEQAALDGLETVQWEPFKVGELFDINSYKKRFDANKVEILDNGQFPYVVRTSLNNGIRGYISEDEVFLNDGNTISFGQDTATMFYQEKPYFTGDKIKILKAKSGQFNKENAQFFIAIMTKSFSSFSWGSSSFNIKIIENQIIQLPITANNTPDYAFMELFILAMQKVVIKNVVDYLELRIDKTDAVIG